MALSTSPTCFYHSGRNRWVSISILGQKRCSDVTAEDVFLCECKHSEARAGMFLVFVGEEPHVNGRRKCPCDGLNIFFFHFTLPNELLM